MTKGVVTFPLMMEYVKRSRMGAANAGMSLFQGLIRNGVTLFVGVWLAWWSLWFLPQAGYHVETTFPDPLDRTAVASKLASAGVDTGELILRPIHQYGVDGDSSMRWWIHRDDARTHDLLKQRKKLTNRLSPLKTKLGSPLLSEEGKSDLRGEIDGVNAELKAIDQELDQGTRDMRTAILPALDGHLYLPGDQILGAQFQEDGLRLELVTIEALDTEQIPDLIQILQGPQYRLVADNDPDSASPTRPDIEITVLEEPTTGLAFAFQFDRGFLTLAEALSMPVEDTDAVFEQVNTLIGLHRAEIGEGPDRFVVLDARAERRNGSIFLEYALRFGERALQTDPGILAAALAEESSVKTAGGSRTPTGTVRFRLELVPPEPASATGLLAERLQEVDLRLGDLIPNDALRRRLAAETYLRVTGALAEQPFYITVPEHTPRSNHREREYEYFFASQTLQIATDLIGFGIIWFLLVMEKKGVVHRAGAEEDDNR